MADASILLDIVLADLRREDITRVQSQISQSLGRAVNLNVQSGGSGKLDEDMRRVAHGAEDAGQSVSQLNNILKRYNQNMLKAEVASDRVEDKFKSYAKRINITNRAYGELNASATRLRQSENKNQKEIDETETQMRQLRQEVQRLQKEQHKLRMTSGLDPLGKKMGGIRTVLNPKTGDYLGLKESFTTMQGIGLRFKSLMAGQIGSLMLFSTAIMAVRSAVRAWVSVNLELEKSQANLKTVTVSTYGDIDRSMAMMEERSRELSHVVPLAAAKISESMYYLASGGLKDIEVMEQISGSVILATSALIENKLAAETVTTAYNVWSDAALRGTEIADKFQITIARNQVTGEQLAESFKYVAATGKMIGYSLDEVLAITGALGTLGIRGSMAGTSLNQAFLKISKKQGILRNIGIEVVDSSGKLKEFIDIIEEFRRHYGTTIDAMEQEELGKVLDIRAARGIIPFIENIDTLRESLTDMGDAGGASMKAMLEQTYTMTSSWELIKNIFAEIAYKTFPDMRDVLTQISGAYTARFAEALKTPEGIAGYEKILQEQLKAGKFTSYFGDVGQIEKYIEQIREAGLETKSLTEFTDQFYSKTLTALNKVFAITPSSFKPGFWQRYFGMEDDSAIKQAMMKFENVFKNTNKELSETLLLEKQIKQAMEGWEPFKAVAPFKVPEIKNFEDFYSSFQKRYKEVEEIDIFGVGGVPDLKKALTKLNAENEKMTLEFEKNKLALKIKGIKTSGDVQTRSIRDIHNVEIGLIDLEKEAKIRAVNAEIETQKGLIKTASDEIRELGGDPAKAADDKRIKLLEQGEKALVEKRNNIEKGYRQKKLIAETDTDKKISDYEKKLIMDGHKIDQQLDQSAWNLRLATVRKGTEEEFDLRRQMFESLRDIDITIAEQTGENLKKRLEIIENNFKTTIAKLDADLKKMRIAPERKQAESLIQNLMKMRGKTTEEEFIKRETEIADQIKFIDSQLSASSGAYREELIKELGLLEAKAAVLKEISRTQGFEFMPSPIDPLVNARIQSEMDMMKAETGLGISLMPETDYEAIFNAQEALNKKLYDLDKEHIENLILDADVKNNRLSTLSYNFAINEIKLQKWLNDQKVSEDQRYITAWENAWGNVTLKGLKDEYSDLEAKQAAVAAKMTEAGEGTEAYEHWKVVLDQIISRMGIIVNLQDEVIKGNFETGDDIKKWKFELDDIPHAYSIISRSIQSMNKDMDDTTLKMLDMGEGLANLGIGLAMGNPIMAISGAFMALEAMFRKEDDDREQISKSAYEISRATQSGIRADYGQAQTINVQMSNAIKMDFLIPEGLTQGRQEQIAETLADEIGRKLSDRGLI